MKQQHDAERELSLWRDKKAQRVQQQQALQVWFQLRTFSSTALHSPLPPAAAMPATALARRRRSML